MFSFKLMEKRLKPLVGSGGKYGKVDKKRDGKTPPQRSLYAKKAARTRKRRRGNKKKFSLVIDNKLLDRLDKLVNMGGAQSKNEAILTAIRQYLIQLRML